MLSVSIITPTMAGREPYLERLRRNVAAQDYSGPMEHIVLPGTGLVGEKRNMACEMATGDIIVCMDDDDQYGRTWVSESVRALVKHCADITGLGDMWFQNEATGEYYRYTYPERDMVVGGGTMCFWRAIWKRTRFRDVWCGEDTFFQLDSGATVFKHQHSDLFLATIHDGNTSRKRVNGGNWTGPFASR